MEEKANKVLIKIDEINRKLNYDKIVKFFLAAIAIVIVFSCIDNVAYASGLMGYDGNNSPFEKVTSGWGQFMSDKYRPNYSLDTGDVGTFEIVDKGLNALSNVFFSLVTMISWVGINVFNFCVNNSIVDAFAKVLDKISRALVDGVFNKLFLIMFMFSLVSVCIYYAKKNFAAIVAHFCAFAVIVGLAAILANSSAKDFVVDTTKFSK
ncbi:MAG: TcpH, partial [Clostridium sp.]